MINVIDVLQVMVLDARFSKIFKVCEVSDERALVEKSEVFTAINQLYYHNFSVTFLVLLGHWLPSVRLLGIMSIL